MDFLDEIFLGSDENLERETQIGEDETDKGEERWFDEEPTSEPKLSSKRKNNKKDKHKEKVKKLKIDSEIQEKDRKAQVQPSEKKKSKQKVQHEADKLPNSKRKEGGTNSQKESSLKTELHNKKVYFEEVDDFSLQSEDSATQNLKSASLASLNGSEPQSKT